jgi:hypothetical protein
MDADDGLSGRLHCHQPYINSYLCAGLINVIKAYIQQTVQLLRANATAERISIPKNDEIEGSG